MRKAFFSLFKQDLLLSWRNGLILVTVITLGVIIALYWTLPLIIPENASLGGSQIFLDETADQVLDQVLKPDQGIRRAENRDDLETRVEEANGLIGIIAEGSAKEITYTLVFKSRPAEKTISILKAVLRSISAQITGQSFGSPVEIELLREKGGKLSMSDSMIAVMLAFEVMILGFLFAAVAVFAEKKEGSIRSYRVSPSGLSSYVFSKTLVFTLVSTAYGLIMTAATVGIRINLAVLTAVLLVSCAMMTLLGLGIAAFFNNISEWFITGVLVLAVNMLSILPYQIPTYSAGALTFLPGYSVIFGVREILFPTGKEGFLSPVMLTLGIELVIFAAFALWAVRRRMMKET